MEHCKKIDLEKWARKEHYLYYTQKLKIEFNMTASVDVTKLLAFCHAHEYKFYPVMIYFVTKVLNRIENFKMFQDDQGSLCLWDKIIPNYTIFHQDDKTFSDCWSDFSEDFPVFYQNIMEDMRIFKDRKGIKVKDNQPPNFYCISCVPWISFTGYSSRVANGEPSYFPIVMIGKYEKSMSKIILPVNITIAHAVCDGYHVGLFFEYLQNEIDLIEQLEGI